jgi:hypothetical protein
MRKQEGGYSTSGSYVNATRHACRPSLCFFMNRSTQTGFLSDRDRLASGRPTDSYPDSETDSISFSDYFLRCHTFSSQKQENIN